jgi:ribonuclease HI
MSPTFWVVRPPPLIIRDSDGDVITVGRERVDYLHNPFQAEVISCLQGVQAAIDLGISYLEVDTDAKMVRHTIMSNDRHVRGGWSGARIKGIDAA